MHGNRLDSIIDADSVKIHLIKVDIEGFEARALRGLSKLVDKHPPCAIIFESNEYVTRFSGVDPNSVLRQFIPRGYRLFDLGGSVDETPTDFSSQAPQLRDKEGWELRLTTQDPRCAAVTVN